MSKTNPVQVFNGSDLNYIGSSDIYGTGTYGDDSLWSNTGDDTLFGLGGIAIEILALGMVLLPHPRTLNSQITHQFEQWNLSKGS
jgi:hypothetical protein